MFGNRSDIRDRNKGSSSLTIFEIFISRKTLMTIVFSVSFRHSLFVEPRVLSTDKIFLRPKS